MRIIIVLLTAIYIQSAIAAQDYLKMVLTPEGLGPIKIGMTPKQISEILGIDITKVKQQYHEGNCYSYMLGDHPVMHGEIRFLINEGTLGEISVFTDKIKTNKGFSTNKTIKDAEIIYKDKIKKGITHYGDNELSIDYPAFGTKMKMVGTDETVRYIGVGREPEIDFIEGCL